MTPLRAEIERLTKEVAGFRDACEKYSDANSLFKDEIKWLQDYKRKQAADIMTLGQMVGKLEVENEQLRTALQYYATREQYQTGWNSFGELSTPVIQDGGEKARRALERK